MVEMNLPADIDPARVAEDIVRRVVRRRLALGGESLSNSDRHELATALAEPTVNAHRAHTSTVYWLPGAVPVGRTLPLPTPTS